LLRGVFIFSWLIARLLSASTFHNLCSAGAERSNKPHKRHPYFNVAPSDLELGNNHSSDFKPTA
jgi:hypothetical protein